MNLFVLAFCALLPLVFSVTRLSVKSGSFYYGGKKLFLSGVNQAWVNYGDDFGNSQPKSKFCALDTTLSKIQSTGGNSVRIWLHIEGDKTPLFDSSGNVIGTDSSNTLISEMRRYLQAAYDRNVLVFFVLWNGAVLRNSRTINLLTDTKKLQTYIDKVLVPMVQGLANEPALGGWEIMNEPEGSLIVKSDSDPCYDTSRLSGSGAGWAGARFTMKQIQTFVNLQASAIKSADPLSLVTVGSWSEKTQTNSFGYYNYYSDSCLVKAGGKSNGVLDFFQMHTYSWKGVFSTTSPIRNNYLSYGLSKPLVVGEFNEQEGGGMSITQIYNYVYSHGYGGGWGWSAESQFNNFVGIAALRGLGNVGLSIPNHPKLSPSC